MQHLDVDGDLGLDAAARVAAALADLRRTELAPVDTPIETRVDALRRALVAAAGAPLTWHVEHATTTHDEAAARVGLRLTREIVELVAPLPLPSPTTPGPVRPAPHLRPFRPGHDEPAVLEVNAAAFAWHPEQGRLDLAGLLAKEAEPWFDAAGFLVAEPDPPAHEPALAGFCWTRRHVDVDPPEGEIFVIGVHPAHHGRGLGRALVLAGLDHLAAAGMVTAVIWTESDNEPALALYRSLGFVPRRHHRWYGSAPQTPDTPTAEPTA